MSMAETTISIRVQELTAHFAATARPVEVDVAGVTIMVPIRPEASAACYERGAIPLTTGEFAWLTVARESLNGQLDIPIILRARAVLPVHAQLGGIVLTGEHSGDPYFPDVDHPTLVVCVHATPPVGKRPLLVVTPAEISELFEAGTGALALLVEVKSVLPDAHTFRVRREGVCRGEFDFLWQSRSIHLCDRGEEQPAMPTPAPSQLLLPRNVLPMLAALNDTEKGHRAAGVLHVSWRDPRRSSRVIVRSRWSFRSHLVSPTVCSWCALHLALVRSRTTAMDRTTTWRFSPHLDES